MLEKIYNEGFLDYTKLILKYYHKLGINEIDSIILIKMLDLYKTTKKIRPLKLSQETDISKKVVEESLNNLIINNIYEIDVVLNDNGLNDERISFAPLFSKIEKLYQDDDKKANDNVLQEIISSFEMEFNKPLSPQEFVVIDNWFNVEKYTKDEINEALREAVKSQKLTLSFVERKLIAIKKKSLGVSTVDTSKKAELDKIMNLLNE